MSTARVNNTSRRLACSGGWLLEHAGDPAFVSQLAESVANLGMLEDSQGHRSGGRARLAEASSLIAIDCRRRRRSAVFAQPGDCLEQLELCAGEARSGGGRAGVARRSKFWNGCRRRAAMARNIRTTFALCYNNLAALESRGQAAEAIEWYGRAVALAGANGSQGAGRRAEPQRSGGES